MRALALLLVVAGCDGVFNLHRPDAGTDDGSRTVDAPGAPSDVPLDGAPDGPPPLPTQCPATYIAANGMGRYRYVGVPATWVTAMQDCGDDVMGEGPFYTHLVVLDSDVERGSIGGFVSTLPRWIGLSDRKQQTVFQWVTDQDTGGYPPASGGPWSTSQPSNGTSEDCVELTASRADLDDVGCATQLVYVCECDLHPVDPNHF